MRREIDRQLLVQPNCLMFFCDDTGHEDFRDRNFPVFGIGGCGIMAGAIEPVLKQPWRAMKAEHFGGSRRAPTCQRTEKPHAISTRCPQSIFSSAGILSLRRDNYSDL